MKLTFEASPQELDELRTLDIQTIVFTLRSAIRWALTHPNVEVDEKVTILDKSVENLELSRRAENVLRAAHIQTLGQLIEYRAADLALLKQCGKVTVDEIRDKLTSIGLDLKSRI